MVAGTVGNAKQWKQDLFPYELIPDILELVVDSWKTFKKPGRLDLEVSISKAFTKKLQYEKNKQNSLPFKIRPELVICNAEDNKKGDGRIDICFDFIGTANEETYFALECKRLRIPYPPPAKLETNNSDYVGKDGMMCFVTGKYSDGVLSGAMVGYVMDGNIREAVSSLTSLIKNKSAILKLVKNTGLDPSALIANSPNIKQTRHAIRKKDFTLHHLFLAV